MVMTYHQGNHPDLKTFCPIQLRVKVRIALKIQLSYIIVL